MRDSEWLRKILLMGLIGLIPIVMLAFGASVLAGMLGLGVGHPPVTSASVALLVLGVVAVLCVATVFLLRSRRKMASHQRPDPLEGGIWDDRSSG
jgi:hypothetical protein